MSNQSNTGHAGRLDTAARRRRVLELRRKGEDYRTIAKRLMDDVGADRLPQGWDARYACKDLRRLFEQVNRELREEATDALQLELERLDAMLSGLWKKAETGDTEAIDRVLKIMERRSKYLGLDEPDELINRVDVSAGALQRVLMEALEDFPAARKKAAQALAQMDESNEH